MPVYKVWDCRREKRKSVLADNLKDLLFKGGKKLGIDKASTLVFESDGTEVDDEEVLLSLDSSVPLMVLRDSETWCTASSKLDLEMGDTSASEQALRPVPVVIASKSEATASGQARREAPVATASKPEATASEQALRPSPVSTASKPEAMACEQALRPAPVATTSKPVPTASDPSSLIPYEEGSKEHVASTPGYWRQDLELPNFSYRVEQILNAGVSETIENWGNIINETANFYFYKYPCMDSSTEYQQIGQKMFKKYPSIAREGIRPWSLFNCSLSMRIRHMRWNKSRKSKPANSTRNNTSSFKPTCSLQNSRSTTGALLSDEDYQRNMDELRKEWRKKSPNRNHIKTILKESFNNNQKRIKSEPDGKILPILEAIPCYQDETYLLYDFHNLLGQEKWTKLKQQLPEFIKAVTDLMAEEDRANEGDEMSEIIWFIERKTSFKGKITSILTEKKVDGEEVTDLLKTGDREAPKIIVLVSEETNERSPFVVGDGAIIDIKQSNDTSVALLVLMGVYYVMDLEYPKVYSQVLGILQTYWLQSIPYSGQKSNKYRHFASLLQQKMFAQVM